MQTKFVSFPYYLSRRVNSSEIEEQLITWFSVGHTSFSFFSIIDELSVSLENALNFVQQLQLKRYSMNFRCHLLKQKEHGFSLHNNYPQIYQSENRVSHNKSARESLYSMQGKPLFNAIKCATIVKQILLPPFLNIRSLS